MTTSSSRRALALGMAFSGLLTVAACGGDDSSDWPAAPTEATTVVGSTDATVATSAPSDATATTGTTMAATPTTGVAPTSASGGVTDCEALAQQFRDAVGGVGNPSGSPEDLAAAFDELAANVPADLRDDVDLVGELLEGYAAAYAKVKDDPTKVATDPDVLAALQRFSGPEYLAASQAISAYFTETCRPG